MSRGLGDVYKRQAHFLEHKLFEQENGTNSLDVLTALGVNANAYTTNDHTAYLFESTDNFYPAMDELMDYVQHPYFTDENVEKDKLTAYKRVLTLITHLYAVLASIHRGTIILQQMNIGQAVNFTPSKNIECLSAVIHQVLAVVLPFQCLLNFTSLV